jgi:hypothetical protein
VVAPADRVAQRAVPVGRVAADGEESQPLVQAGLQPVQPQRRVAGCGQLDRQRHAVQSPAQRRRATPVRRGYLARRLDRAGPEQGDRIPAIVLRDRQPGDGVDPLVRKHQPGPAGRQHRDSGTAGDHQVDALADPAEQVLAVVQQEQAVPPGQRGHQRRHRRGHQPLRHAHRLGHGRDHSGRIRHPHQIDEPRPVPPPLGQLGGDADRQPGLTDPARTGRGDQAVPGERRGQRRPLADATDERRDRDWQPAPAGLDQTARDGVPGQAAAIRRLQLAQHRRHVALHRASRDDQRLGDLRVRQVPGDQSKDLGLPRRQPGALGRTHGGHAVQCRSSRTDPGRRDRPTTPSVLSTMCQSGPVSARLQARLRSRWPRRPAAPPTRGPGAPRESRARRPVRSAGDGCPCR